VARRDTAPLLGIALDRASAEPLHRQLRDALRDAILAGLLAPGHRLPSSRTLAAELGCARNTVLAAYEQLAAEGYLSARHGSGTRVSPVLPETLGRPPRPGRPGGDAPGPAPTLSRRGARLAGTRGPAGTPSPGAFAVGVADSAEFPFDQWGRLLGSLWRRPDAALVRERDAAGHRPLREALARHLNAVRGLRCTPEEIVVTSGSQQGVDLVARLLLEAGDRVWIEDPGYPGLRGPLLAAGLTPVPVPVDDDGLDVAAGRRLADDARLAVVAPSHQYPLGAVLSLPRRLALLDRAHATDGWVLEDDYDSEYRYGGRPLTALRGLDAERRPGRERVVHLGSFSKTTFPTLRLGWLVVPRALAGEFVAARRALEDHPSAVIQPVMARFLESGRLAAHVRRMRVRYGARQARLLDAAARHLDGLMTLTPDDAGMHLVGRPAPGLPDDVTLAQAAAEAGVTVTPLSAYAIAAPARQGLLLGYAAVAEADIEPAVVRLADALRDARRG
jgi:GntR family transcriptional regulator/MocR family aminotransferase